MPASSEMNKQVSCGPVEHWDLSDGKVAMPRSIGPQDARIEQALMKHAAGRGIKRMEGFVMASNAKMLEFMRFLGFEVRSSAKGPQIKLVSRPLDDLATI